MHGRHAPRTSVACLVLWPASLSPGCRQDMHDQPRVQAARAERLLRRRALGAAAGGGHGGARPAARGRAPLHRARSAAGFADAFPFPVDRARCSQRGQRALRHLLHALPRPAGRGDGMVVQRGFRQAAVASTSTGCATSAAGLLLRRDHERLRRHAGLRGPDPGRATAGRSSAYVRALQLSQNATLAGRAGRRARRAGRAAAAAPRPRPALMSDLQAPCRAVDRAAAGRALVAGRRGPAAVRARLRSRTPSSSSAPTCSRSSSGSASRIGCLSITLIHHLTGGLWGLVIRRLLEAGARTLPLPRAALPADRVRAVRTSTPGRSRTPVADATRCSSRRRRT